MELYRTARDRDACKTSHDIARAMARGILANCGLATATSAPSASSHARVKGEKKAAISLADVWWIDQASDATMPHVSKGTSLNRMSMRLQHKQARMKSVG